MNRKKDEILYLATEHARKKDRELAQYVNKSPQLFKYTVSVMKRTHIISHPYAIFDYSYFDLLVFRVYFKGGYISEIDKENILGELKTNKYVLSMYELLGEYDLVLEIAAPNPSRFNKEIKKIITQNPTLNNYRVLLNIVTYLFPRHYLIDRSRLTKSPILIGGDRNVRDFDTKERAILETVLRRPLAPFTHMAKEIGLNVRTVTKLVHSLEKDQIIKGYRYSVDTQSLGIKSMRIFLQLHNNTTERENELTEFMQKCDEVVQFSKTVGDWDAEIDIESYDDKKIRYVLLQIRRLFKDIIKDFNVIEFYTYYKRSYLPHCLFESKQL